MLGLVLDLAACSNSASEKAQSASKAMTKAGALKVTDVQKQFLTIEPVVAGTDEDVLALPGRVAFRPQAQFAVGAPVSGRVSALLARAGQAVKAGAVLLTLDSSEAAGARAALDQAATRLANAENIYKRNVAMVEKGVGLEVERQDAEARLKESRAEFARARHSVDLIGAGNGLRVSVRAPADGVVTTIRTSVGASVVPGGEPLLELGDPRRLQIVAQVPEGELHRVAAGQDAEVTLAALAVRAAARVETITPRVDPDTRRAPVYFALTHAIEGLRDGMLAQLALRVSGEQRIEVPTSAVLIRDGKRRIVYVEKSDGSFEAREVQTGRNREGRVAILKGLAGGDRIVVRGALLLDTQAELLL